MKASPASVAVIAACAVLAAASPAVADQPVAHLAPSAKVSWVAHPVRPTVVRSRAGGGRQVWRTPSQTSWTGGPVSLLVLGSEAVDGVVWLRVRLPVRPNTAAGWINSNFTTLTRNRWRVTVHTRTRQVDVFDSGRRLRRFAAVVGKPSTRTPHGLFAVWEKVHEPDRTGFLGPWALHLTAHSNVLFNFGGGPGRVAIHGRDGVSLLDPLGSADSHGCVRVLNRNVIWLARVLTLGAPVRITG